MRGEMVELRAEVAPPPDESAIPVRVDLRDDEPGQKMREPREEVSDDGRARRRPQG